MLLDNDDRRGRDDVGLHHRRGRICIDVRIITVRVSITVAEPQPPVGIAAISESIPIAAPKAIAAAIATPESIAATTITTPIAATRPNAATTTPEAPATAETTCPATALPKANRNRYQKEEDNKRKSAHTASALSILPKSSE